MLGKLLKHEWKEMSRYLLPIHIIGMVLALCGGLLFTAFASSEPPMEVTVFATLGSVLVFCAMSFGTIFLIAAQYYKSLFSDEAYLTHTLPVQKTALLSTKIIVGSIWILIDGILCTMGVLAWILPFMPTSVRSDMIGLYTNAGIPGPVLIMGYVLLMLISCVASSLLIYTCISIGQFFTNHRILGAVIAYIVINSILQIIVMLAMSAAGILTLSINSTSSSLSTVMPNMHYYLITLFVISTIAALVEIIAGYFICRYTLEKSLNLN